MTGPARSRVQARIQARLVDDARNRRRTITTPEGLALNFTLAGRGARLGALLLDLFLMVFAWIAITVALGYTANGLAHLLGSGIRHAANGRAMESLFILWLLVTFALHNAWFLYFELGPRGATPGKRIMGLRIAARDGGRLTVEMVIARNLLRDVELFVPLVLLGLAGGGDQGMAGLAGLGWLVICAGMPLFNRDRLRPGDLIAGTWVVEAPRRRLEAALTATQAPAAWAGDDEGHGSNLMTPARHAAPAGDYQFSPEDLGVYGEYELQTLERILREGQAGAMAAVARAICAKIGWSPPGEIEVRPFLSAYYTQLRARLETGMRMGRRKADKFSGEE